MASSPSNTPNTDLWLERSRLAGMILGGVSYGVYLLLTGQASLAILHRVRRRKVRSTEQRLYLFLVYIAITFILATIGFATNVSYTQTIWIDQRNIPGGPPVLIITELNYWINRVALSCYYIMEWFMSALLLFRVFVIWNRNLYVMTLMSSLFLGSVAMAILVLVQSRIEDFYDINVQIAYLSLTVGTNVLYTLLVIVRLLSMHGTVSQFLGKEHAQTYISVAAMIVESAAMYSVLGILYIASFATHSNCSNLIFLSISHVQGIAQLLIILRVVEGKAYESASRRMEPNDPKTLESAMVFRDRPRGEETDNTSGVFNITDEKQNRSSRIGDSDGPPNDSETKVAVNSIKTSQSSGSRLGTSEKGN